MHHQTSSVHEVPHGDQLRDQTRPVHDLPHGAADLHEASSLHGVPTGVRNEDGQPHEMCSSVRSGLHNQMRSASHLPQGAGLYSAVLPDGMCTQLRSPVLRGSWRLQLIRM